MSLQACITDTTLLTIALVLEQSILRNFNNAKSEQEAV